MDFALNHTKVYQIKNREHLYLCILSGQKVYKAEPPMSARPPSLLGEPHEL